MEIEIPFNEDKDGFTSQECPSCSGHFKAIIGEENPAPISFCPYCAYEKQDCWWTPEQVTYIESICEKAAFDEMDSRLEDIVGDFNSSTRSSGYLDIKISIESDGPRHLPSPPSEPDLEMPIVTFSCCNKRIKHDGSRHQLFCINCGSKNKP